MILTYNKMLSTKEDNKNNEVIMHRHKPKHRYSYKLKKEGKQMKKMKIFKKN